MNSPDRVDSDAPDTFRSRPRRSVARPAIALAAGLALAASLAACATTSDTSTASDTTVSVTEASADSNTAAVVAAAEAFTATLTDDQLETLMYDYSDTDAKANWSNLPEGQVQRNGLAWGDLDEDQQAALLELLHVMLSDDGYQQVLDTMAADDYLGENGGGGGAGGGDMPSGDMDAGEAPTDAPDGGEAPSGEAPDDAGAGDAAGGGLQWSSELYYISFFGTPATDSAFMIAYGGHHLAINIDYQGDTVTASPEFLGIEPQEFTSDDGDDVEAMASQKDAVFAVLESLSDDELDASELDAIYDDVVMGPGEDDGDYPTETGVLVSDLSAEQQELVTEAITQWVGIIDEDEAAEIIQSYVDAYDETYVMWSGSTDSDSEDAYFRISGPAVWIEYVHQTGVGFNGVHLHSVWRDKTSDYGA